MTRSETVGLFAPGPAHQRMDLSEAAFMREARRILNWEAELLRLELADGTKPRELYLPIVPVKELVAALGRALWETAGYTRFHIQSRLREAIHRHQSSVFAAGWTPDPNAPPYYPTAGLAWYEQYALRLVGISQTALLDRAKDVVAEGIRQGTPLRDRMAALQQTFTGFGRNRLETIVRTETAKVYEHEKWESLNAEPEVVGYEFVAVMDERTSEICASRHGRRFPTNQIEGNQPPLHFSCRSTTVPVFSWEIEDGTVEWNPVPESAEPPLEGFGTTAMEIPLVRDRAAKRLVRQAG